MAAPVELVKNGNFSQTSGSGSHQINYDGFVVTDWTLGRPRQGTAGYLFEEGTADSPTAGALASSGGRFFLWGPKTGVANGLDASPAGGNFIAIDGGQLADADRTLSQTINGLVAGQSYTLTFFYAGAQEYGFTGNTTDQLIVSLGSQSYATPVLSNASHRFTGWYKQTTRFTATSASEVLSFLALGTPTGLPPTVLFDGISLTSAVPEPATWMMMIVGFGVVGGMMRRRPGHLNQTRPA